MTFTLSSPAFTHMAPIPAKYTCQCRDISPPLSWTDPPHGTKSLVPIVTDPDAPDPKAPKVTWIHWVLYNITPEVSALPEGAASQPLPADTLKGLNSWNRTGYGGPCPPIGRHRYVHRLYALDTVITDLVHPSKQQLEERMKGHILAEATLIGTYEKKAVP